MKRIRVLGLGWYGAHLAVALLRAGYEVEVHEIASHAFAGASGGNPARLHEGFHYPRSRLTRAACQEHRDLFMAAYGHLTRGVPINLYAIAAEHSLVDFANYTQTLRGEVEFVTVLDPLEFGLVNVEGAILTGERHIVIDEARVYFEQALGDCVRFDYPVGKVDDDRWDMTIDCTFCANDAENIDRYEPCLTVLLRGTADRAVTIMDGGFGSVYPWNEDERLSSLTNAALTPFSKSCKTYAEARALLNSLDSREIGDRALAMVDEMARYWPEVRERYRIEEYKLSIRAMPLSGADARLVDVVRVGERALRVRAGKIDAVFHAERIVMDHLRR